MTITTIQEFNNKFTINMKGNSFLLERQNKTTNDKDIDNKDITLKLTTLETINAIDKCIKDNKTPTVDNIVDYIDNNIVAKGKNDKGQIRVRAIIFNWCLNNKDNNFFKIESVVMKVKVNDTEKDKIVNAIYLTEISNYILQQAKEKQLIK